MQTTGGYAMKALAELVAVNVRSMELSRERAGQLGDSLFRQAYGVILDRRCGGLEMTAGETGTHWQTNCSITGDDN